MSMMFFILLFLVCLQEISHLESRQLKINILPLPISRGNEVDVNILQNALEQIGHHVHVVEFQKPPKKPKNKNFYVEGSTLVPQRLNTIEQADINIYMDNNCCFEECSPYANKNYLLINPESWATYPALYKGKLLDRLKVFDAILVKTKEALRILQKYHPHVIYLGFTSEDHYKEEMKKSFSSFLHLQAFAPKYKRGTPQIISTWEKNQKFPLLYMGGLHDDEKSVVKTLQNVHLISDEYLSQEECVLLKNQIGFHLCPSQTEGFGHTMQEGMSTKAVVITTDAPPMNEFIQDKRCLVKYNKIDKKSPPINLYYVDENDLEKKIQHLLTLPTKELEKMGEKNRQKYLSLQKDFLHRLQKLFS